MPRRIGLTLDQWPPADRAAWERANTPGDVFDTAAVAAHWRPKTRDQARYAYGRWLTFLHEQAASTLDTPLAARVTAERLQTYVSQLEQRIATMSIAAELQHLGLALSAMAPIEDWAWLRQRQYAYQKRARPREKRHKIVDPRCLVELGQQLMDEAGRQARAGEQARDYRDGLLIALLAMVPLRRRSVAVLAIGRHLQWVTDRYVLELDEADTKSGHPIEIDVPSVLTPRVTQYLERYRLLFPHAAEHSALWLSSKGGPLGADAIHDLVCRRTEDAFGFPIHPHLFRDIAATAIAREAPHDLDVARDLLTHASGATTQKYYVRGQSADAARQYAELVARVRKPQCVVTRRQNDAP